MTVFVYQHRLEVRSVPGTPDFRLVRVLDYPSGRKKEKVLHEGTEGDCNRLAKVVMDAYGGAEQWTEVPGSVPAGQGPQGSTDD